MKIGDFAKACGTKISVLRHYDKIGLLKPVYIDRFTEYRYYDPSQIAVFERIAELKAVGFSLSEIRRMLCTAEDTEDIFSARKAELERQLRDLEKLKTKINGGIIMKQKYKPLIENTDLPFENDERVIGKWRVESENGGLGDWNRHLYFLPGGEFYWCFGWTKGKLIYDDGVSRYVNDYRLEQRGDDLYMIVDLKSQDWPETGEVTAIALRKLDSIRYTRDMIARKDNISKPFIPDDRVLGKWKAFCYFHPSELKKEDFVPLLNPPEGSYNYLSDPYFKEIEFSEGGHVTAVYGDGIISGDEKSVWTRGYWLRKWNSTACAYEIRSFDGKEYLIIEWKSGDYRFGGRDSDYYVMVREQEN
ncbi:DNA-binding transcriptional regulator, MerR family [Ruminococcaceae bacterium FB2012]|nr:DNA-binding transcriptional regulator, MerR family [Ruminococcaceae bacterium FB2012]